MRVIRTRYGARVVHGRSFLSKVLARPGPTQEVFDVLAATAAILAPGPRLALLGFAGGGIVAPLRALGYTGTVEAVDRDVEAEGVFRELSDGWAGDVRVTRADAVHWLQSRRRRFDVVVDDLSIDLETGPAKPEVCVGVLPPLVRRVLGRRGIAVANTLPVAGQSAASVARAFAAPHREARVVVLRDHDNRIVAAGASLPAARDLSRMLRATLIRLRSRLAGDVSVRTLVRAAQNTRR